MGTYRVPDDDTESEASSTPKSTRIADGTPCGSPKSKLPPSRFPPYSGGVPTLLPASRHSKQFWRLRPVSGPFGEHNVFRQLQAQAEFDRIAASNPVFRRSLSQSTFHRVETAQHPNSLSAGIASRQVSVSVCGSIAQFTSPSHEGTANEQGVGSTCSFVIDPRAHAVHFPDTTRTDSDAGLGAGPLSPCTQSRARNPDIYTPRNSQQQQQSCEISSHKASNVATPKRFTKSKSFEPSSRATEAHMSPPETLMQPYNNVSPAIGALILNPGTKRKASTTEVDLRSDQSMMESPEGPLCKVSAPSSQSQAMGSSQTTVSAEISHTTKTSITFAAIWRFFSSPLAFVQTQVERAFTFVTSRNNDKAIETSSLRPSNDHVCVKRAKISPSAEHLRTAEDSDSPQPIKYRWTSDITKHIGRAHIYTFRNELVKALEPHGVQLCKPQDVTLSNIQSRELREKIFAALITINFVETIYILPRFLTTYKANSLEVRPNTAVAAAQDEKDNLCKAAEFLHEILNDDENVFAPKINISKHVGTAIWTDITAIIHGQVPPSVTEPPFEHRLVFVNDDSNELDESERPIQHLTLKSIKDHDNELQSHPKEVAPETGWSVGKKPHQAVGHSATPLMSRSERAIFHPRDSVVRSMVTPDVPANNRVQTWEEFLGKFSPSTDDYKTQTRYYHGILKNSYRPKETLKRLVASRAIRRVKFTSPPDHPSLQKKRMPFPRRYEPALSWHSLDDDISFSTGLVKALSTKHFPKSVAFPQLGRLTLSKAKDLEFKQLQAEREKARKEHERRLKKKELEEAIRQREEQQRLKETLGRAEEVSRKEREIFLLHAGLKQAKIPILSPPTQDMVQESRTAANPAMSQVTESIRGDPIKGETFARIIDPKCWLNDEAVNSTLECLVKDTNEKAGRDPKKNPKLIAVGSAAYDFLEKKPCIDRPLKRQNISRQTFATAETILVPRCQGMHWTLGVIRPQDKIYFHLDSLRRGNGQDMLDFLKKIVMSVLGKEYDESEWGVGTIRSARQANGHDCGMFTIMNSICIAAGAKPEYDGSMIPHARYTVAKIILNKGFDGVSSLDLVEEDYKW